MAKPTTPAAKEMNTALSAVARMREQLEARGEKAQSESVQCILDDLATAAQEAIDELHELIDSEE